MAAGAAAGNFTTRAANPFPQKRAGLLDWSRIDRGQKPSGAAHDGGHRSSDVALDTRADWRFETGRFGSRKMENSFGGRTHAGRKRINFTVALALRSSETKLRAPMANL